MRKSSKIKTSTRSFLIWTFLGILTALIFVFIYFGFTKQGARWVITCAAQHYLHPQELSLGQIQGNLVEGFTLQDVRVRNTISIPEHHSVWISRISVRHLGQSWSDFEIELGESSLELLNSKPIHIEGRYKSKTIHVRLRSEEINVRSLTALSPHIKGTVKDGKIGDMDMTIDGSVFNPSYEGTLRLTDLQIMESVHIQEVSLEYVKGVLSEYMEIHRVKIEGIEPLSKVIVLRVQKVRINYKDASQGGLDLSILNARTQLPNSNVIVLSGGYAQNRLDLNIYSNGINPQDILSLFPATRAFKTIDGSIGKVDLFVRGPLDDLSAEGRFLIEKFSYSGFSLLQVPLQFNIRRLVAGNRGNVSGMAELKSGQFIKSKTHVELLPSRFSFSENLKDPALDIHARSTIDKTNIHITVKGTKNKPDLILESDPPRSREMLMLMLATGQSWKRSAKAVDAGAFSPEVVKDFIDYFIFNGQGATLAQRLGLDSLAFHVDRDSQGVSLGKSISDQLKLNYGIERSQTKPGESSSFEQKIGGEIQVTDHVAVEATKSATYSSHENSSIDQTRTEGQSDIKLKYQTTW